MFKSYITFRREKIHVYQKRKDIPRVVLCLMPVHCNETYIPRIEFDFFILCFGCDEQCFRPIWQSWMQPEPSPNPFEHAWSNINIADMLTNSHFMRQSIIGILANIYLEIRSQIKCRLHGMSFSLPLADITEIYVCWAEHIVLIPTIFDFSQALYNIAEDNYYIDPTCFPIIFRWRIYFFFISAFVMLFVTHNQNNNIDVLAFLEMDRLFAAMQVIFVQFVHHKRTHTRFPSKILTISQWVIELWMYYLIVVHVVWAISGIVAQWNWT